MSRVRTSTEASPSSDASPDADPHGDDVDSDDLRRLLTARAGEVVAAERERALRGFDDDSGARRVLSTMAVRIAVQAVEPAVVASERGGDGVRDVAAELFAAE